MNLFSADRAAFSFFFPFFSEVLSVLIYFGKGGDILPASIRRVRDCSLCSPAQKGAFFPSCILRENKYLCP